MLGEGDARFDGHIARRHLEARLGFRPVPLSELPQEVTQAFRTWHTPVASVVPLRAAGVVLLPPRR